MGGEVGNMGVLLNIRTYGPQLSASFSRPYSDFSCGGHFCFYLRLSCCSWAQLVANEVLSALQLRAATYKICIKITLIANWSPATKNAFCKSPARFYPFFFGCLFFFFLHLQNVFSVVFGRVQPIKKYVFA